MERRIVLRNYLEQPFDSMITVSEGTRFLCFLRRKEIQMDANVNYLGLINMLQILKNTGLISRAEARKIAARLKVDIGADIVIFI
jgi:hypothetical protein